MTKIFKIAKVQLLLYALIASLLFSECIKTSDKIPEKIIPEEKLISILVDIHLAAAYITVIKTDSIDEKTKQRLIYDRVLKNHNIDREIFNSTIKYYASTDIKYYNNIYDEVVEELNKIQGNITRFDTLKNNAK